MIQILTIEREYGSGAPAIAKELATRLGWKLWDHALTEELARLARCDVTTIERRQERVDPLSYRLVKVLMRGSFERTLAVHGSEFLDADRMLALMREVVEKVAAAGGAVIVGRGAPYFLTVDQERVILDEIAAIDKQRQQESG